MTPNVAMKAKKPPHTTDHARRPPSGNSSVDECAGRSEGRSFASMSTLLFSFSCLPSIVGDPERALEVGADIADAVQSLPLASGGSCSSEVVDVGCYDFSPLSAPMYIFSSCRNIRRLRHASSHGYCICATETDTY